MEELIIESNQTPIEIALGIDGEGLTTARKLYEFLELNPANFSHWCKRNITENEFATENEDYVRLVLQDETPTGGKIQREDFKLTAHFAKKLSMASKSEKGERARDYFVGCEQLLKVVAEANRKAEAERHRAEVERAKGIAVRQALTNALKQSHENERMHGHAYSTYTNIIYKTLFGKNANQLREEFGIGKKDNLRDCLTAEDLKAVQDMEMLVSGLISCGWGYDQIKEFVQANNVKRLAG